MLTDASLNALSPRSAADRQMVLRGENIGPFLEMQNQIQKDEKQRIREAEVRYETATTVSKDVYDPTERGRAFGEMKAAALSPRAMHDRVH